MTGGMLHAGMVVHHGSGMVQADCGGGGHRATLHAGIMVYWRGCAISVLWQ